MKGFLRDRDVANINGLFLSCRQINREMEDEHIKKGRPLLNIIRDWRSIWEEDGVEELQLAQSSEFDESLKINAISVGCRLFGPPPYKLTMVTESHKALVEFLRRVYSQSHQRLVLGMADGPHIKRNHLIYYDLIWIIHNVRGPSNEPSAFAHLERLVVQLETWAISKKNNKRTISQMRAVLSKLAEIVLDYGDFPEMKSAWAAGKDIDDEYVQWSYGFDFKDGLPEEEAVAWKYEVQQGFPAPVERLDRLLIRL